MLVFRNKNFNAAQLSVKLEVNRYLFTSCYVKKRFE
jgi:hypothetical protein